MSWWMIVFWGCVVVKEWTFPLTWFRFYFKWGLVNMLVILVGVDNITTRFIMGSCRWWLINCFFWFYLKWLLYVILHKHSHSEIIQTSLANTWLYCWLIYQKWLTQLSNIYSLLLLIIKITQNYIRLIILQLSNKESVY